MNNLLQELAPISSQAWEEINEEAKRTLKTYLAARRLMDFSGPKGFSYSAVSLGRNQSLKGAPQSGVEAKVRQVRPLVELRTPFKLSREELDAIERGAKDADLDPLKKAAEAIALAEDKAVFHGYAQGDINGIFKDSKDNALKLSTNYEKYPQVVAQALNLLLKNGVTGPYAIALGPQCYTGLTQTVSHGGYPIISHVRKVVEGPLIWAPAINGAVVLSTRGGDFELVVGQDFSIGYSGHTDTSVQLYFQETMTFLNHSPEAAVPMNYSK